MAAPVQDAIVLLGDSITEFSYEPNGLANRLARAYVRKMDVINRGFSGYNTDWIIPIFEQCFPMKGEQQQHVPTTRILVIWFGANDATAADSPQHVPLDRYKANLTRMIRAVRLPDSPRHSPDTSIVLMTPPPIDDFRQAPLRTLEASRQYAEVAREVARTEKVTLVDVWAGIWERAAKDEGQLHKFLADGLHLNENGYKVAFEAFMSTIAETHPLYHYDNLQTVFVEFEKLGAHPEELRELTKKRHAIRPSTGNVRGSSHDSAEAQACLLLDQAMTKARKQLTGRG
ncbi:SGNH hydrolase [Trametes coccinea BRFM310]|uniref:SGNH hydrolase n=1 Tax=Trametes coccinea (strain BRFM310) TaxID=1353009 RepID=A0A1Y2IJB9_TRAC3|nr:SGNH hydrolase [Trametes coccinea BRFM310]